MSETLHEEPLRLPAQRLNPEDRLRKLLPSNLTQLFASKRIFLVENLYDAMTVGATWYKNYDGLSAQNAFVLTAWMQRFGKNVGEITDRFYLTQKMPSPSAFGIVPIEKLSITPELSGAQGLNRAPQFACGLEAKNDREAIQAWLLARANNPHTYENYRKEAERFYLWCIVERQKALSDIKANEAARYLRWLRQLGRTTEKRWAATWLIPQKEWMGFVATPRNLSSWRPFLGPLSATSRRNAVTIVRQLFNFLRKTGYLVFNPFDQVASKVPLLKGEGAPRAFADRTLNTEQWKAILDYVDRMPTNYAKARLRAILMMGHTLGMRTSEMIEARADWIVTTRIGLTDRVALAIVGKGAKVRRLPLNARQQEILRECFLWRGYPSWKNARATTPILTSLNRGPRPYQALSRSGLYRILTELFEKVAAELDDSHCLDAAKLRAASTHWLRHSFAVQALQTTQVNIVQAAMGHSSVATTGHYLRPEEEAMSTALNQLGTLRKP